MSDMDLFKIRDSANDGIKIDLFAPDGKPTEHWLVVRSIWSDDFQSARSEVLRAALEDGKKAAAQKGESADKALKEAAVRRQAALIASLIADWSFKDKPCTEQNKTQFLIDAPQIRAPPAPARQRPLNQRTPDRHLAGDWRATTRAGRSA